jgi:hypothetical protein
MRVGGVEAEGQRGLPNGSVRRRFLATDPPKNDLWTAAKRPKDRVAILPATLGSTDQSLTTLVARTVMFRGVGQAWVLSTAQPSKK